LIGLQLFPLRILTFHYKQMSWFAFVAHPHFSSQLLHNPLALLSFICNGDKRWIGTSACISDVGELGNGHGEVDPNRELPEGGHIFLLHFSHSKSYYEVRGI
jgi:hypothetical protein